MHALPLGPFPVTALLAKLHSTSEAGQANRLALETHIASAAKLAGVATTAEVLYFQFRAFLNMDRERFANDIARQAIRMLAPSQRARLIAQ